ncbi:hypothetical protein KA005_56515, partial [bacterium]|nr:hypothetical protein [bacterium]
MSLKRAFVGAAIAVALFAVAYTYFNVTISTAILNAVDLGALLDQLPITIGVSTVILAIVGIIAGLIGGFFSGKSSFIPALILTLIFAVLVVAGNMVYTSFSITGIQDILSLDPLQVVDLLSSNIVSNLYNFAGGIVG